MYFVVWLVAEVLELAGNYARSNKRSRVKPKDIKLGISTDDELHKVRLMFGFIGWLPEN